MTAPLIAAYAPGRVELLGNHTDYNEGVVLGAAINRGLTVSGEKRGDGRITIRSDRMGAIEVDGSVLRALETQRWANYLVGVVGELRALGIPVEGFSARITGDLPAASGLSSSAALEVSAALFLLKLCDCNLPPIEIAKVCQRAEHHFVGIKSGLLDQVTSLYGKANHAVFFDCRTEEVQIIPFPADLALIVAESGSKRELAIGEYNLRYQQCRAAAEALHLRSLRDATLDQVRRTGDLPKLLRLRATHIVTENDRVWRGLDLLRAGDAPGFGALLNESHESSKRNFENSTPELDQLVAMAQSLPGVIGARLTGGGFGGATITLCERDKASEIAAELRARYSYAKGKNPRVIVSAIANGALVLQRA